MSRPQKQKATIAAGAIAFSILLASCGGGESNGSGDGPDNGSAGGAPGEYAPAPEGTDVELTIWFGREDFIPDDAFESFMTEYPHITVKTDYVPLEQITTNFIRQAQAGNPPDIIQVEASQTAPLALRNLLYGIDPIIDDWQENDPDLFDVMADATWDLATYDETRYGMALYHDADWSIFRPDILDQVGLDVPETWDEVIEAATRITAETDMYGYGLDASRARAPERDKAIFAQMGGQWEDGVMQIDSEAGHYWLGFYQQLTGGGLIDPATIALDWPDYIANFADSRHAMGVMSRNVWQENLVPVMDYGVDWEVNPVPYTRPGAEDQARYVTRGWAFLVAGQTSFPYEAGFALRYMADDEQALSVAVRYQPTSNTRAMSSDEYLATNPWAATLAEAYENLEARPMHPNQAQLDEVIRDAMQEALENPDSDVTEMAARYQAMLDEIGADIS